MNISRILAKNKRRYMEIESKLDEILARLGRIERNQKLGIAVEKKKKKQIRSFEASKHFENLKHWDNSFEPTSNTSEFLTVTAVFEFLNEHNSYKIPLPVVGMFLNYYFKDHQVMKAVKGGSAMYKCYKIRIV